MAHSRQKMSPLAAQATGERDGRRHNRQDENGKKESRVRRVAWEPHVDLRRDRSWEVKKARDVLRLPASLLAVKRICRATENLLWDMLCVLEKLGEVEVR
jgi:hypothetical protein